MIQNKELDKEYWNIVKGLGILFIVLGHCCFPIMNYVYAFHVPLFFFVSGYLYDENKYGDRPFDNFKRRMQSNWLKYVLIYVIYICLHNVFINFQLLNVEASVYSFSDVVKQIGLSIFFGGEEFLISPLWFVPVLVEASVMLGFIVTLSRKLSRNKAVRLIVQLVIVAIITIMGYVIHSQDIVMFAYFHVALIVMPYIWIGYLLRNYCASIKNYLKWYVAVLALVILILYAKDHLISLKDGFISPEMYIIAILGIYVCLYLSMLIQKVRRVNGLFITMGVSTFFIMAFHFTIIRIIDRVYDGGVANVDFQSQPYLGHNLILLPVYLILGIGIPILITELQNEVIKWQRHKKK